MRNLIADDDPDALDLPVSDLRLEDVNLTRQAADLSVPFVLEGNLVTLRAEVEPGR